MLHYAMCRSDKGDLNRCLKTQMLKRLFLADILWLYAKKTTRLSQGGSRVVSYQCIRDYLTPNFLVAVLPDEVTRTIYSPGT